MNYDHNQIEHLAAHMCNANGGQWGKKYTKTTVWIRRAMALIALAAGNETEARRVMQGNKS